MGIFKKGRGGEGCKGHFEISIIGLFSRVDVRVGLASAVITNVKNEEYFEKSCQRTTALNPGEIMGQT